MNLRHYIASWVHRLIRQSQAVVSLNDGCDSFEMFLVKLLHDSLFLEAFHRLSHRSTLHHLLSQMLATQWTVELCRVVDRRRWLHQQGTLSSWRVVVHVHLRWWKVLMRRRLLVRRCLAFVVATRTRRTWIDNFDDEVSIETEIILSARIRLEDGFDCRVHRQMHSSWARHVFQNDCVSEVLIGKNNFSSLSVNESALLVQAYLSRQHSENDWNWLQNEAAKVSSNTHWR